MSVNVRNTVIYVWPVFLCFFLCFGSLSRFNTRFRMLRGTATLLQLSFLCCVCPLFVLGGAGKSIEETASYRVAIFFGIFIILSYLIEVIEVDVLTALFKCILHIVSPCLLPIVALVTGSIPCNRTHFGTQT